MKTNDWLPHPEAEPDPMRAARGAMRPALPKRFYERAAAEALADGTYALALDGRPARTPARHPLALPTKGLAEALAEEWNAQGEHIDPGSMPLTKIANSAIDGVAAEAPAVRDDLVRYAASDLVCYRAGEPERLVAAQGAAWDPVLAWSREELGARFILSQGVMHVEQPPGAIEAVRHRVNAIPAPFKLASLHVMTTLTGSVLIALAHAEGPLSADEAWAAAHADEIFQESAWGEDYEAIARRSAREAEFRAASRLYGLA